MKILKVWFCLHLLLAVCVNAKFTPWVGKPMERFILPYIHLTGADGYFGFFSPNIGTQLRVSYELNEGEKTSPGSFLTGNNEIDLRINNIMAWFWTAQEDKKMRRALSASLAGKMLAKHPEADSVKILVDYLIVPEFDPRQENLEMIWKPVFRGKFAKNKKEKKVASSY